MRLTLRLIVTAFAMTCCGTLPSFVIVEPTPIEANTMLTEVMKRKTYVFAITIDGLFRASLATKRWERIQTPPELPLNGTFAALPAQSPLVLFVARRSYIGKPIPGQRYGLYLSRDHGTSWELISQRDDFGAAVLDQSGVLFAVTGHDGLNLGKRLLRSSNMGKTWRDITGTDRGWIEGIEPDPNHPGLVRFYIWSVRSYLFQADDENYRWKESVAIGTDLNSRQNKPFFSRDSWYTGGYRLSATLANYFEYDFENNLRTTALDVVPLVERFEFAKDEPVKIGVRVVYHFDPNALDQTDRKKLEEGHPRPKRQAPRVLLGDDPDGVDFWGLRVEFAGSKSEKYPPASAPAAESKDAKSNPPPRAFKFQVFNLTPSDPYERGVDLSKLADFSKAGEYRVQMVYGLGTCTGAVRNVWHGFLTSPVFTVVIRP